MIPGQNTTGPPPITTVEERVAYRNRFVTVYDDAVTFPGGVPGTFLRIVESEGRPGVAMLALAAGQVALVRVYRYPIRAWQWGVPRGFAHGGDPAASARAELAEELGEEPADLEEIGQITTNSGLLAGMVHLFAAGYPRPVSAPGDRREVAEVRWLPTAALRRDIAAGKVTDGITLALLAIASCRGLLPPSG